MSRWNPSTSPTAARSSAIRARTKVLSNGGDPSLINEPCQGGGCVAGIAPLDCQVQSGKIYYNVDGDIEVIYAFSATVKYFEGGRLAAVATVGRDKASLEAEWAMERPE